MSGWDPGQYARYGGERLRPAMDLLARVPLEAPGRVVDLGCGTGTATRWLQARWPQAHVVGVDQSAAMLGKARAEVPGVEWVEADIARWRSSVAVDLVYSNAALHWLPDHAEVLARWMDMLLPGGVLAVQVPDNFAAPSHTLVADTILAGSWRARLEPLLRPLPVHSIDAYHGMLAPRAASLDLWETQYLHLLEGPDPVKEWVKGTWLKPFLDALEGAERDSFEAAYADRVRRAYPPTPGGVTLFPFKRLFMVVTV